MCLYVCYACTDNKSKFFNSDKMIVFGSCDIEDTLYGKPVEIDSLINPCGIEAIDSFLVVLGSQSGKLFSVYNSRTNSLVSQFGQIGHAKYEFVEEQVSCQLSHDNNDGLINLTVPDFSAGKLRVYDFSKVVTTGELEVKKIIDIKRDVNPYFNRQAFSLGNNDYVVAYNASLGLEENDEKDASPQMTVRKNDKKEMLYLFSTYMNSEISDIVYQNQLWVRPDGKKILSMFPFVDLISITDLDNFKTTGVSSFNMHNFDFYQSISENTREYQFDNLVIQNFCGNISDSYIMVCQDMKTKIEDSEAMEFYDTILRIIDWDGELLHTLRLKESIFRMAFCESTGLLYGFDARQRLYCYDLSKYLK